MWQGDADADILKALKERPKVFFHSHLVGTKIMLDREAEWRDW